MVSALQIYPLPSVDVQVLHRSYQPVKGQDIFDCIVRAAVSLGLPATDCKLLNTSTDQDIRVLCGNYHCLVTQSDPLVHKDHLETTLEAFTVKNSFPEAAEIVASATAHTQISVRKGLIPHDAMPDGLREAVGDDLTAFCIAEEAQLAMALTRETTRFIVEQGTADAVFWGASLFLMKPDLFLKLATDGSPELLYLHAHLYGETDPDSGKQLVGVIGAGAPALIGYTLEFRPCSLPPDYLVRKMHEFLLFTQTTGQVISDGEVFGKDENEKIQVLHHLAKNGGAPEIELKVVHNPEYGIVREAVPTIYKHYDGHGKKIAEDIENVAEVDLDPTDPVDAAILEHLQALKPAEIETKEPARQMSRPPKTTDVSSRSVLPETKHHAEDNVNEQPEFSRRATPPQTPPAKRVSMEELRSFARRAQAEQTEERAKPAKSGFLSKFFRKKSD